MVELLLWLLDDRVPRIEAGNQLLKALNVLMLKILVSTVLDSESAYSHVPVFLQSASEIRP